MYKLLNPLNTVDIIFFIVIGVIIIACIVIYFLVPILNKEQYEEARRNLYEREKAFKKNANKKN